MTQIDMFESPFEMYARLTKDARLEYEKAMDKYYELKKLRDELCPHTEIEDKYYYFSGSYSDTAYTERWVECKCCGMTSAKTVEYNNYYG